MVNVLIFVKNDRELELAASRVFGRSLLEYTLAEVNKLEADNVFLINGLSADVDGVIKRRNIAEVAEDLEGDCLLISPFYPFVQASDYKRLLEGSKQAFLANDEELVEAYVMDAGELNNFEECSFDVVEIDREKCLHISSAEDLPLFHKALKQRINKGLLLRGVNIVDPDNTYIGPEVVIDKGSVIYPNVVIEGKCFIGRNCTVLSGTYLNNVVVGDYSNIISSRLVNCRVGKRCVVGPSAHVHEDSVVFDRVSVGDNVEVRNCKIGKNTRISHMSFLSNTTVGESAVIGCGVSIVDSDGAHKHSALIGDYAVIGSNACLIAPIKVGDYGVVAAGSTIDGDVNDGDMAISRLYQTNKVGYGYKYIKK